jgi:hypothetical protein
MTTKETNGKSNGEAMAAAEMPHTFEWRGALVG